MKSVFYFGQQHQHHVEVYSNYFGTREEVKVNGKTAYEKKRGIPFWLTQDIEFSVTPENDDKEYKFLLKYNCFVMKSEAYIDDTLHCACLFPQVIGYNAMIIAIVALIWS